MKQNIITILLIIILVGVFFPLTANNKKEFPNMPTPTFDTPLKDKNPFFNMEEDQHQY